MATSAISPESFEIDFSATIFLRELIASQKKGFQLLAAPSDEPFAQLPRLTRESHIGPTSREGVAGIVARVLGALGGRVKADSRSQSPPRLRDGGFALKSKPQIVLRLLLLVA